ncbi:MAG: peptide ABC transporter substrate-binding protein [Oscillospiraceae bacterium]
MKLNTRILAMVLTAALAGTLFAGCTSKTPSSKPESTSTKPTSEAAEPAAYTGAKELKMYVAGFQNLDPQIWSWGTHVDRMGIFEGLTQLTPEMGVRLANAEKLEHSEDYTVWTATVRKDLKWSDGSPLNAKDYFYALNRVIDPQYLSGKTSAVSGSEPILNVAACQRGEVPFSEVGIKLVDDYTLEFTLGSPRSDFDVSLTESWALPVPQQAIEEFGDKWAEVDNIVCNGPYKPIAREEDVHLTLGVNDQYYEKPALEKIEIYAGTQNQLLAYKNGDINVATILAADIDAVNKDEELKSQLKIYETSVVQYIGLLKSSNDVLQMNPKIRQAMSLSIDRKTIATDIDKDTVVPAYSLVYPGFVSWSNDVGLGGYDVEKAKTLMAEAGYPNGEGLPEMTCLVASTPTADMLAVVDMIQRGTGIKIKIVNAEWAAFVKDRDAYHDDGMYGIFIDAWNTPVANVTGAFTNKQFDPRLANLDSAGQKAHTDANKVVADEQKVLAGCKNKDAQEYQKKLMALAKESDPAKLDAAYKELETMRQQDSSCIPLYWGRGVKLVRPEVKGYVGNPLLLNTPPLYFKDVSVG